MTRSQICDTMNPTNPVLTVAPIEEETEMFGATNNKITALYCRLSQEDARMGESLSIENQKSMLLQYCKEHHFPNPLFFVDATDIIGLKQNPTNGRRFSPIFSFIGHFSIQNEKMLLLKQRRKTEYGKDKAFVDLSKSMNAFRHFREQEALWQTQSKKYHWRNFTLFRITHSVCETMTRCSRQLRAFVSMVFLSPVLQDPVTTAALRLSQDTEGNTPVSLRDLKLCRLLFGT